MLGKHQHKIHLWSYEMSERKWLWLDLETEGLDPQKHRILEVAAIKDGSLQKDGSVQMFHAVIGVKTDPAAMSPAALDMHTKNGLLEEINTKGGMELASTEQALIDYLGGEENKGWILCGNTIRFDHGFLKVHMPRLFSMLHYRMIDVSSFKEYFRGIHSVEFYKPDIAHRATEDILASVEEMAFYSKFISMPGVHHDRCH
jgi:oligoribonuclease